MYAAVKCSPPRAREKEIEGGMHVQRTGCARRGRGGGRRAQDEGKRTQRASTIVFLIGERIASVSERAIKFHENRGTARGTESGGGSSKSNTKTIPGGRRIPDSPCKKGKPTKPSEGTIPTRTPRETLDHAAPSREIIQREQPPVTARTTTTSTTPGNQREGACREKIDSLQNISGSAVR